MELGFYTTRKLGGDARAMTDSEFAAMWSAMACSSGSDVSDQWLQARYCIKPTGVMRPIMQCCYTGCKLG